MATQSSFSTSGSNISNPQGGLLRFNPLNTGTGGLINTGGVGEMPQKPTNGLSPAASSPQQQNLQGRSYFENLAKVGNPAEQHAAQGWLSRNSGNPGLIPGTPLKKTTTTNPDGSSTTHEFHSPTTGTTGGSTSGGSSGSSSGTPTPTQPTHDLSTKANAERALGAGDFTEFEKQAISDIGAAKGMENYGKLGPNAEAGFYTGANPNTVEGANQLKGLINRPDLAGRAAGSAGLYGSLGNIFGSASQAELTSAEAQAGRAAGQANKVLDSGINTLSGGQYFANPLTGEGVGKNGIIGGATNQAINDFTGKYITGQATLKAADGIQQQIISTLQSNPALNNQPLSAITNLNEFLSGQSSQPGQQLLSQQVNSYIKTLGLDPASVANIAHQQGGTLAQLLDSLRATYNAQNEAYNPSNVGGGSSGGSSGGGFADQW